MTGAIEWPWQYNFPPFFTIQTNESTRKLQLDTWRQLVIDYSKINRQCIIDTRNNQIPLFRNASINRVLSTDSILIVMKDLQRTGHAQPVDKTFHRWYIFWEPLEQIATAIYSWINERGMTGSVCTFFELTQGDSTDNEIFYGLDEAVLAKALQKLEIEKKAEIIVMGDSKGVKFF